MHDKSARRSDRLQNWTVDMQMRFHPAKCSTMHLGKHNPNTKYTLPIDDGTLHEIAQTAEEKDLGVTIDDTLIFPPRHIQIQVNKANSAAGLIRHTFKHLDKESFRYLYRESAKKSHQTAPRNISPAINRQTINPWSTLFRWGKNRCYSTLQNNTWI